MVSGVLRMGKYEKKSRQSVWNATASLEIVMPGLVPGIHVFKPRHRKTWMAGTSPAMTE
jgi:hypothetical protein